MLTEQLVCHEGRADVTRTRPSFILLTDTSGLPSFDHVFNPHPILMMVVNALGAGVRFGPRLVEFRQQDSHALGVEIVEVLNAGAEGSTTRATVVLLLRGDLSDFVAIHIFGTAVDTVKLGWCEG